LKRWTCEVFTAASALNNVESIILTIFLFKPFHIERPLIVKAASVLMRGTDPANSQDTKKLAIFGL
jgi:hypothetical protein